MGEALEDVLRFGPEFVAPARNRNLSFNDRAVIRITPLEVTTASATVRAFGMVGVADFMLCELWQVCAIGSLRPLEMLASAWPSEIPWPAPAP